MRNEKNLSESLDHINHKDYGAYQSLIGSYQFQDFKLNIKQIPKDPYAPPHTGIYRVQIDMEKVVGEEIPQQGKVAEVALRDFFARRFYRVSEQIAAPRRGTGNSGVITLNKPGQAILERSSVVISGQMLEVRCFIGLPAKGRSIDAETAKKMLFDEFPTIVNTALFKENYKKEELIAYIHGAEDSEFLRDWLVKEDLVAFIANGSILARKSGNSDLPMEKEKAIRFQSPDMMRKKVFLPHRGEIEGMGIGKGITLITGGGYHGKSTLLNAIQQGVYNHIPGDGRELAVTIEEAVKIRAYDGRKVEKTDISPFIDHLPMGIPSNSFSSENASGSTSQAASIIEAIEAGSKVLIMDEDTCATNFLIRDHKMQQLVAQADEPITTYIDRAKQLFEQNGISTILVLGGIGDYFDIADVIIQMKEFQAYDVTEKGKEIAARAGENRLREGGEVFFAVAERIPVRESLISFNAYGKHRIYATDIHFLHFGEEVIDLNDLEQLVELSQTKAIGEAIAFAKIFMDDKTTLREIIDRIEKEIDEKGLDVLSKKISGHYARFRKYELAMAINRMRGMKIV